MKTFVCCPKCNKKLNPSGRSFGDHMRDAHQMLGIKPPPATTGIKCDFTACASVCASKKAFKVSWFRGDDVVLNLCVDHKREKFNEAVFQLQKYRAQL